jgi:spore photoproduct lyase
MELKFKKIKAITKIAKQSKVVNFSVKKNENYFANGILTHNCYMKRHKPKGLNVAKNIGDILTSINNHAYFENQVEKPNQTDPEFVTYDISCNEDFALHAKFYDWQRIFDFFKQHPVAKATFATKIIPEIFLNYDPERKVRIRFSLMPQRLSNIYEPNTAKIIDRIKAIDGFIDAGYEVHVNFSPVIVYDNWLEDYEELFYMMSNYVDNKDEVLAEVIFMTHNIKKHEENLINNRLGEKLLWIPELQEGKTSQYGAENVRYRYDLKARYIKEFTELHDKIIPWNTIRYIF